MDYEFHACDGPDPFGVLSAEELGGGDHRVSSDDHHPDAEQTMRFTWGVTHSTHTSDAVRHCVPRCVRELLSLKGPGDAGAGAHDADAVLLDMVPSALHTAPSDSTVIREYQAAVDQAQHLVESIGRTVASQGSHIPETVQTHLATQVADLLMLLPKLHEALAPAFRVVLRPWMATPWYQLGELLSSERARFCMTVAYLAPDMFRPTDRCNPAWQTVQCVFGADADHFSRCGYCSYESYEQQRRLFLCATPDMCGLLRASVLHRRQCASASCLPCLFWKEEAVAAALGSRPRLFQYAAQCVERVPQLLQFPHMLKITPAGTPFAAYGICRAPPTASAAGDGTDTGTLDSDAVASGSGAGATGTSSTARHGMRGDMWGRGAAPSSERRGAADGVGGSRSEPRRVQFAPGNPLVFHAAASASGSRAVHYGHPSPRRGILHTSRTASAVASAAQAGAMAASAPRSASSAARTASAGRHTEGSRAGHTATVVAAKGQTRLSAFFTHGASAASASTAFELPDVDMGAV